MKKSKVSSNRLRLSRRQSVIATSSAALAMILARRSLTEPLSQPTGAIPASPPSAAHSHYIATLTLGSLTYTFDSKTAVDQGNYIHAIARYRYFLG